MFHYGNDSEELDSCGFDGVSLALGALDEGNSGSLLLLDDSLELDDVGVGGTVELLGVGEPLLDGVTVELLALGVGVDDGKDELLDVNGALLDSLDELLSADEDELDAEDVDELVVGPLLGGATLEDGRLSLLDGGSELDTDELLDDSDVEVEGAELDEKLSLKDGWLLEDELDDDELLDEELLLELLDEGRLDDGSLLLLDDGSLLEEELDEGSLDELDDELEELLLDDDELLLELLDDELELLLDDDSLLEDELDEELLDELLDVLLDDGSLDEELELLFDELDEELLLDELELDDELEELGGALEELEELDGHGHFGTQIFLPQIVISQQSPASCTSKCAQGSGADVLGLDDELVSQQMGTSQSSPSSIDTNCPHTNVRRCVGNRIVSPYRSGHGSKVSTVVVSP